MQSCCLPRHLSPFPPPFEVWPGMQNVNKTVTEQKFEHCNQEKKQYIPTSVFSIFSCSSSSVKSPSSSGASLLFLVWPRTLCNPSSLYFSLFLFNFDDSIIIHLVQSKLTLFLISINFSPSTILHLVRTNVTICLFVWNTIQPFIIIGVGLGYDKIL